MKYSATCMCNFIKFGERVDDIGRLLNIFIVVTQLCAKHKEYLKILSKRCEYLGGGKHLRRIYEKRMPSKFTYKQDRSIVPHIPIWKLHVKVGIERTENSGVCVYFFVIHSLDLF